MGHLRPSGSEVMADDLQQSAWPVPSDPGAPLRAEQDGNHLLVLKYRPGEYEAAKWTAATREWLLPGATLPKSAEWAAKFCSYVSPVRTNAELRAAYDRGVKDGRNAAMVTIADVEQTAVRNALADRDAAVLSARREGAKLMRDMAAEVAISTDVSRPADHLGTFYEGSALEKWHRRLYAAAIQDLPLPGDP